MLTMLSYFSGYGIPCILTFCIVSFFSFLATQLKCVHIPLFCCNKVSDHPMERGIIQVMDTQSYYGLSCYISGISSFVYGLSSLIYGYHLTYLAYHPTYLAYHLTYLAYHSYILGLSSYISRLSSFIYGYHL